MNDPSLNKVLQWAAAGGGGRVPEEALTNLFSGESDATRMAKSMAVIEANDVSLENKTIAFDNFLQLIENHHDNANLMETVYIDDTSKFDNRPLWTNLISKLDEEESEFRRYAAWCIAMAVQNNPQAQKKLLEYKGIPRLMALATEDAKEPVRKKAILALSGATRNNDAGLKTAYEALPETLRTKIDADLVASNQKLDASEMESVDTFIKALRANSQSLSQ